ncbi:methyltransferase [Veillonella parvula]|nr:methyltransferase [Veillonella parvula]RGX04150.1 methyltransferase [Veillonella parvula]
MNTSTLLKIIQHSTAQHSTAQHSTANYITICLIR